MPRLRKVFLHKQPILITFSVEQGLMFPQNKLIKTILLSCLARAQALYPVKICHFTVEATHAHILAVVINPADVADFIERFKTESAHAINRLLGRKKRTIWCEGYDSPALLTIADVIRYIVYIYINPVKDRLVNSIDEYPGLTSWNMWNNRHLKQRVKIIKRSSIQRCNMHVKCSQHYKNSAKNLSSRNIEYTKMALEPDAWMDYFGISEPSESNELNRRIKELVKNTESKIRMEHSKLGINVLGATELAASGVDLEYTPERKGRRTQCISSDIKMRVSYLTAVKNMIHSGKEILRQWQNGDLSNPYPVGLFPPNFPRLAEFAFYSQLF